MADCSFGLCDKPVYAKQLCSRHYKLQPKQKENAARAQKRWRAKNVKKIEEQRQARTVARKERKALWVARFGGACSSCGGVYPPCVFDFHHVGEKDHSPGYLMSLANDSLIETELSKCVLLCANCHRIEHHE